jgi:hypothetical protein
VRGHAGAAEHDDVGAVARHQGPGRRDQAVADRLPRRLVGPGRHRPAAGIAFAEAHLADHPALAPHAALREGDDAEALAEGERPEEAPLGDPHHGPAAGDLAGGMQARVAEAGDDEGVRRILRDAPGQRHHHGIRVLLGRDARRPLGQVRHRDDGAAGQAQRRQRRVDGGRHRPGGVRVDDQDARGSGGAAMMHAASCGTDARACR